MRMERMCQHKQRSEVEKKNAARHSPSSHTQLHRAFNYIQSKQRTYTVRDLDSCLLLIYLLLARSLARSFLPPLSSLPLSLYHSLAETNPPSSSPAPPIPFLLSFILPPHPSCAT